MDRCPACGSSRIYPSRLRNLRERFRHLVTGQQPYRCHQCNWRRWSQATFRTSNRGQTAPDELRVAAPDASAPAAVDRAELDRLDPG
jgi:hypothetical protein